MWSTTKDSIYSINQTLVIMNLDTLVKVIVQAIGSQGGISIGAKGDVPFKGYMVSMSIHGQTIDTKSPLSNIEQAVRKYVYDKVHLAFLPSIYYGFWVDQETNTLYMDISQNVNTLHMAMSIGELENQISIFDLDAKEVIYLKRAKTA